MRAQTPARAIVKIEDAENILGQFYFAFGQGAGTIRVERAAIAALRHRYLPNIQKAPGPWSEVAGNVLSLLAQVGRVAALHATQVGRTAISAEDFTRARQLVEAQAHPRAHDTGALIAGPYCAIIPEEGEADSADLPASPDLAPIVPFIGRVN